jgi:hypothetical protein
MSNQNHAKDQIEKQEIVELLINRSILSNIEFIVDTTATISVINRLEYFYNY